MRKSMYLCLMALLVACGQQAKDSEGATPMTVRVSQAETSGQTDKREFAFISKPFKTTELSFRVGGPVTDFNTHPGQFYHKGAVIASIDDRDFTIQKEKAAAIYQQASAEYKRIAALYEKNNISGSSYEKAKSDLAIAKAAFDTASNELDDTRLQAPFDGYIQKEHIERFQDVRASQPVVTFIDLSKLKVEAYIPEKHAMELSRMSDYKACNLQIRFDAQPEKEYTTTAIEVSKSTTTNNISYQLTAIMENKENNLLGGMNGNLSFTTPSDAEANSVFVPQTALCHRPETGTFVWTLTPDNRVRIVPVRIGNLKKDSKIEIISGLSADDVIVLTGQSLLLENQEVSIHP